MLHVIRHCGQTKMIRNDFPCGVSVVVHDCAGVIVLGPETTAHIDPDGTLTSWPNKDFPMPPDLEQYLT